MKHTIMITLIAVFAVVGYSLHGQAADVKDPRAFFEETCSQCHSIDIPKGEKLSKADWQYTVNRMRSNGLGISDTEAVVIIDYLATNYGK